jgi:uncharacterized protein YeaO (DUF488 family)
MAIRTKSVYSAIDRENDGLRIFATRFRGRGLRASRYDVWMANLAPSEALLRASQRGLLASGEFSRRYRKEREGDTSGNAPSKLRHQIIIFRYYSPTQAPRFALAQSAAGSCHHRPPGEKLRPNAFSRNKPIAMRTTRADSDQTRS